MGIMLPLEQKQKIRELRAAWLSYTKIKEMVMELFGRSTLSLHTIHSTLNSEETFATEAEKVVEDFHAEDMIDAVNKAFFKKRNDLINKNVLKNNLIEQVGDKIIAAIKPHKFEEIATVKREGDINPNKVYVCFWDMHYGRTTEALIKNMMEMTEILLESNYTNITLVVMGDNFESPILGWMHESQNAEMDVVGVQQVLQCMDLIADVVFTLKKNGFEQVDVIWFTGNHDRMSRSYTWDPQRIAGVLWYYYLQWLLSKHWSAVSIISNKVCNFQTEKLNFIMHHWDSWFNNKQDHTILLAYWKEDYHNIIVSGHWHNASLTGWPNYSRVFIPGMNITSEYEKHQFITKASPWFVIIEEINNRPSITFRFLTKNEDEA